MDMHTPSAWTFWLSVILVVLAIVSTFVSIPFVSMYAFWVAVVGYAILVIGCLFKTT
jgi:heme/copper-type cytochrome/quinol oxidase subunit 1